MLEDDYRLFNCQRCAKQVRICRRCDRGHLYCSGECSAIRRRESLHRAGARYQQTQRGARLHAARQHAWRQRQMQKVTHHRFHRARPPAKVASVSESAAPERNDDHLGCPPRTAASGRTSTGDRPQRRRPAQSPSAGLSRPSQGASYPPRRAGVMVRGDPVRCDFCGQTLQPFARALGPFGGEPGSWPQESALVHFEFRFTTPRGRRLRGLGDFQSLRRLGLYR